MTNPVYYYYPLTILSYSTSCAWRDTIAVNYFLLLLLYCIYMYTIQPYRLAAAVISWKYELFK